MKLVTRYLSTKSKTINLCSFLGFGESVGAQNIGDFPQKWVGMSNENIDLLLKIGLMVT